MGMLGKAMDNLEGISDGINDLFETQRSIENNRYLRMMANGSGSKMNDVEQMLAAEQQAKVATRRYNILKDPELNKQIQVKRAELLEKTGVAVPIDDIIDVYFNHLNEDGLTQEEEEELAAIQKQFEDEEEAEIDAEIAEQEEAMRQAEKQRQEETQVSSEMQDKLTVIRNIVIVVFAVIFVIFLYFVYIVTVG